jgi:hypothetical protein
LQSLLSWGIDKPHHWETFGYSFFLFYFDGKGDSVRVVQIVSKDLFDIYDIDGRLIVCQINSIKIRYW